ncbi:MAG: SRPBCC family protein [Kineosporiaceae bacterium]
MELQHTFTVPAPVEQAWATLLDVEGIAPCFPGAALTGVDGDEFSGTVKVKLGPVSLLYAGKGRFVERDEAVHRVLLEANGTDKRGNGTAGATVTARLEPDGETATRVVVDTDLKVTGRPAQFGRGVLQDVGVKIIDQFAMCLASRMAGGDTQAAAVPTEAVETDPALARLEELGEPEGRLGQPETGESPATREMLGASTAEPAEPAMELDLGAVVLPVLARRYGPVVLAGLVALVIVWLLRRRAR